MMEEMAEDWGPGPPPPEFKIPPPPLPPFMLPDLEEEDCQNVLDSHLAVCDTTFVSFLKPRLKRPPYRWGRSITVD